MKNVVMCPFGPWYFTICFLRCCILILIKRFVHIQGIYFWKHY